MPDDTPVLDTLAALTLVSLENASLEPREFMMARIAALAAVRSTAVLAGGDWAGRSRE